MSGSRDFLSGNDGVPPCFGQYEYDHDECRRCEDAVECSAEERGSRKVTEARSYARSIQSSALGSPRAVPVTQVQPSAQSQQQGIALVSHGNFVPYEGETIGTRLGKNLILNALTSLAATLTRFLAYFLWPPKEKKEGDDNETTGHSLP